MRLSAVSDQPILRSVGAGSTSAGLAKRRERPGCHPVFQNIGAVSAAQAEVLCSVAGRWTYSKPGSGICVLRPRPSVIANADSFGAGDGTQPHHHDRSWFLPPRLNDDCSPIGRRGAILLARARRTAGLEHELPRRSPRRECRRARPLRAGGTAARIGDASTRTLRRPASTAYLPAGAAVSPRRARRRRNRGDAEPATSSSASSRLAHRKAAAAVLALIGTGVLLFVMLGGHGTPRTVDLSKSTAVDPVGRAVPIDQAFTATIATIRPKLHALARAVHPAHRAAQPRHRPARSEQRRHARAHRSHRHTAATAPARTVAHSSPPATAAPQQQTTPPAPAAASSTYTPASTAGSASNTSTPSQTSSSSSSSQTTAPSTNRPAGPTHSDPLGGYRWWRPAHAMRPSTSRLPMRARSPRCSPG